MQEKTGVALEVQENNLPRLLTINDIMQLFHFSRNKASNLIHSPGFPKIKIGKQYRIPEDELKKWIIKYSYNDYKM